MDQRIGGAVATMADSGETVTTLERTAPGLFHALRRSFAPESIAQLIHLYEVVVNAIGLESPTIPREAGVSFNPWPARLSRLLLSEGAASAETIGAALASLLPSEPPEPLNSLSLRETVAEVRAALVSAETRLSLEGEGIVLAFILDEVRHLHVSTLNHEARLAAIERARRRVDGINNTERWGRLVTLVRHALSRWS